MLCTDCVAVDAYAAGVLGLDARKVLMIHKAHQHGLGEIELGKLHLPEFQ